MSFCACGGSVLRAITNERSGTILCTGQYSQTSVCSSQFEKPFLTLRTTAIARYRHYIAPPRVSLPHAHSLWWYGGTESRSGSVAACLAVQVHTGHALRGFIAHRLHTRAKMRGAKFRMCGNRSGIAGLASYSSSC
jgi:hypothetical protein